MPEMIAFVSPKGGCGATFVCAGIWYAMAAMGKKVLAVDLCSAECTLDFATGLKNESVYDIADVLDGSCTAEDAVCVSSVNPLLNFLRGADVKTDISKIFEVLSDTDYDFVLFDVPSDEEREMLLKYCQKLAVVTDCSQISAKICSAFVSDIETDRVFAVINKIIPSYISAGIFPTVDELLDSIGIYPIGLIPWSPKAVILTENGIESGINDCLLETAFSNICRRLMGESVPAVDFKDNYSCFEIKKRFIKNRR